MFEKMVGVLTSVAVATGLFAIGAPAHAQTKSASTLVAQTGAVDWSSDLNSALGQARGGKYVLADFYTDWCLWCKRMDRDTFANPKMMAYLNSKFVCVKVNAENPAGGRVAATKYKVNVFPCALVFDPSGKLLGKISGFRTPEELQKELESMIKNPPADPMAE